MHPVTHLLTGWTVAECAALDRRDRAMIAMAAIAPDVDGLGFLLEQVTRNARQPLYWYSEYHHALAHNLAFAVIVAAVAALLARRKVLTPLLALLAFHLHLLGDLVGSRGPDGYPWPIPYLAPFTDSLQLTWSGQWELNAWPNIALTVVLIFTALYLAWLRGYSPVELVSKRADRAVVKALRRRFGFRPSRRTTS